MAQTSTDVIFNTATSVAFGSITGSFVVALTNTRALNLLEVINDTNQPLWVSTDGTNNHVYIRAGESWGLPLGSMQLHESSNVSIKHTGVAPTSGNVYISSAYSNL